MIDLLIFYAHTVAGAAVFTRRWQEGGISEGVLSIAFMALIFFVGWGIASFLVKLFMPPEGFGHFFNRDTMGLTLLTAGEGVFYYFYFRGEGRPERTTGDGS
jgi:hypothetical protein